MKVAVGTFINIDDEVIIGRACFAFKTSRFMKRFQAECIKSFRSCSLQNINCIDQVIWS